MRSELVQISEELVEPIPLPEAKFWLKIESDDEDELVSSLITAARQHAEAFCRRSFAPGKVWQLTLDRFPHARISGGTYYGGPLSEFFGGSEDIYLVHRSNFPRLAIELPMGPVTEISSIAYMDSSGVNQSLDASAYSMLQGDDAKARIFPVYGTGWPYTRREPGSVVITFAAGLPPSEAVKLAIKMTVDMYYRNPDAIPDHAAGTMSGLPLVAERILLPHRIMSL